VVYRVHDLGTGRELALKQLAASASQRVAPQAAALFEREYFALAQLAHPRVIAVHDYGLDANGRYYTMELLDGGDLKHLSPMPAPRACQLMLEVCSSLALLHSRRLVHRDVTPRNVRCTRDGHAKLIDFGAMVPMGACSNIAGTPAFIAPEVVQQVSIDGRADLFSLGATLYYTLTGRPPWAVRHLSELLEAYAREPAPPSQWVAGIPPALDALCAALLRIDPGQRPRSAFEVMHKLAAIIGSPADEPLGVSQAYLARPLLCGREAQLRSFRQRSARALQGTGSALMFRSAPGLGRSRLLDTCALEAKTLGLSVARAASAGDTAFGVAIRLCEQLAQALPEPALRAADRAGVRDFLFEDTEHGEPRLRRLDGRTKDRERLQQTLGAWLACLCETHALALLVDDVQRLDEPSLAWLAALALAAPKLRLLLTLTADTTRAASSGLQVLTKHSSLVDLQPLTRGETQQLLGSVFGHIPHLPMLAERIYGVARGNPRDSLVFAQHLVDTGVASYRDGQWTLPAELRRADLPESAGDALRARIGALPPLARKLAQCQALLGMRGLRCDEYRALAPEAATSELDAALLALLGAEVLESDAERYRLSHPALADILCRMQSASEKRAHHLALYELYARSNLPRPYLLVPHLVAAGRYAEALDVMAANGAWLDQQHESAIEGLDASSLARDLECLLRASAALDRPEREAHELRRHLCTLAVVSDNALHARVAPAWLAQLRSDSGLSDYRSLPPHIAPQERLQRALDAAALRYEQTPQRARVYTAPEAIKHLAVYVVTSSVIGVRTADTRLMQSLPELVEPFAPLSPALHAIWQNTVGMVEHQVLGRRCSAARRHRAAYEQLRALTGDEVPYIRAICGALAHAIGSFEAYLGRPSALDWAAVLDRDPMQCVGAMEIRRSVYFMRGEPERAQHYEQQADLLSLRAPVRRMFDRSWALELEYAVLTADLVRIRRIIEEAGQFSVQWREWRCFVHTAQAYFLLLRGDPSAALASFEVSIGESDANGSELPAQLSVWLQATAGSMLALSQLGRDHEAAQRGQAALARCEALGVELGWHRIARALARAEAKLGETSRAAERVERLLATEAQEGVMGLQRAATHAARAQIAIHARDTATARAHVLLAVQARGGESSDAAWAYIAPLLSEARKHDLDLALGASQFEASVLSAGARASRARAATPAIRALCGLGTPEERAARVLERLCSLTQTSSGHLFLVAADGELAQRAIVGAQPPSAEALEFVRGFFAQQLDDALLSDVVSRATHQLSLPGIATYYAEDGVDRHLILLSCKADSTWIFAGVALIAADSGARVAPEVVVQASLMAAELLAAGDTHGARTRSEAD